MRKSSTSIAIILCSILLAISCKSTDSDTDMDIITTVPDVEISCDDLDKIPDNFQMEDPTPLDQAVSCRGLDYPDWETSLYVLPYPVGTGYQVKLNNCSSSYHREGEPDALATDFEMPIGTCITASRAGKVVYVRESGEDYEHPNNLVIIEHIDKTFAQYMHLTKDGAAVKVGDEVAQGQFIGLSGATGLAGYPHLHFIVTQGDWKYPYFGIPITFKNTYPNKRGLHSNKVYFALSYD